jgi:hypothetical protein
MHFFLTYIQYANLQLLEIFFLICLQSIAFTLFTLLLERSTTIKDEDSDKKFLASIFQVKYNWGCSSQYEHLGLIEPHWVSYDRNKLQWGPKY